MESVFLQPRKRNPGSAEDEADAREKLDMTPKARRPT